MRSGRTAREANAYKVRGRGPTTRRGGPARLSHAERDLPEPLHPAIQGDRRPMKQPVIVPEHQSAPRRGISTDRRNHMLQQVSQTAFLPHPGTVVNRWSLLDGGKNLDLEIHGCGCGCGGCGCSGCGCGGGSCGCGCSDCSSCSSCGCGTGGDSATNTDTSTFGECVAAVATEAAIDAVVTGAVTAGFAAATGLAAPAAAAAAAGAASAAGAVAAVEEARENEACNPDNWSKWYEAPDDGGPAA